MSEPIIRTQEGLDPKVTPWWDTIWMNLENEDETSTLSDCGEWAVVVASEEEPQEQNLGGLQALDDLGTAILIQLGTKKRLPDEFDSISGERGGWHGDTFDIETENGERELGSLLWTLERGPVSYDVARLAEDYAADALQTLIDQGVVGSFQIDGTADLVMGRLTLRIQAYDPAGESIFKHSFAVSR